MRGEVKGRCPRCDEELAFRKRESLQHTWPYLIAAICYVPANLLSLIMLTASIMVPSAKIPALAYLLRNRGARLVPEQPPMGAALTNG